MIRLHAVVEGQTEETFLRDILAPELWNFGVFADAHRITTGRRKGYPFRGGFLDFEHLRRDLSIWMKQEPYRDARFTTMIDLYGLPVNFPGLETARQMRDPLKRVEFLEERLACSFGDPRLIPYIQCHEFEALLFSETATFLAAFPARASKISELGDIRNGAESPEHINDGAATAPSKRICSLLPEYEKATYGPLIARKIGIRAIERECAHFRAWVAKLRDLSDPHATA